MSTTPQDVLRSFEILPAADQHVVAVEICRRIAQAESEPFSDEELSMQADALFLELDEREANHGGCSEK